MSTITSIKPESGSSNGGVAVTVKGTLFVAPMRIFFGEFEASSVVVVSVTEMTCVSPELPGNSKQAVYVVNASGVRSPNSVPFYALVGLASGDYIEQNQFFDNGADYTVWGEWTFAQNPVFLSSGNTPPIADLTVEELHVTVSLTSSGTATFSGSNFSVTNNIVNIGVTTTTAISIGSPATVGIGITAQALTLQGIATLGVISPIISITAGTKIEINTPGAELILSGLSTHPGGGSPKDLVIETALGPTIGVVYIAP